MTNDEIIAALIGGSKGLHQSSSFGDAVEVTFSFKNIDPNITREGIYNFTDVYGFLPFQGEQEKAARSALFQFDAISGLSFREVENDGLLQFGLYTGRAGLPDDIINSGEALQRDFNSLGYDIWLNHSQEVNISTRPGEYGYFILLHEIGHTLGLKHPGPYNEYSPGPYLTKEYDNTSNTVMSYTSNGGLVDKLGEFDALALQHLYGQTNNSIIEIIRSSIASELGVEYIAANNAISDTELVISSIDLSDFDIISRLGSQGNDQFDVYIKNEKNLFNAVIIDAGEGIDTIKLDIGRNDIWDVNSLDGVVMISLYGTYGSIWLDTQNVERVTFEDAIFAFDLEGPDSAGAVYRLYQAALGRSPDQEGLGYWIDALDNGMNLTEMSQSFIESNEFMQRYGNAISDQSFVSLLYNNILGRDPDQSGFDYWINEIESGTSRAEILPGFSESQENQINVIGDIANGIEYQFWAG